MALEIHIFVKQHDLIESF